MEGTQNRKIRCITKRSAEYPERMKRLPDMPEKLYVLGNMPDELLPSMAVVGARMSSPYGQKQAFDFAKYTAGYGVQIISGMALGIDSQSHRGALAAGAPTFAVLGCGADVCYPAANRKLYEDILAGGGGILSEYPPGTQPRSWFFPARNRLISALSDLVLIVEAKDKSGSLITANCALEQGKTVYAVPGDVGNALSRGCNKLIFDGAGIAWCPEILLGEWGISEKKKEKTNGKKNLGLARDLELVYSCLDLRPQNLDYFIRKTGFSPGKTGSLLTELQLMGLAGETGRHYYVRLE